ncbi:MAG TPA: hypothetical protein VEQ59_22615, partial [Polyangiaceae bacterium]|nr:hypothetical protein [Polyangiaceae bacterium]
SGSAGNAAGGTAGSGGSAGVGATAGVGPLGGGGQGGGGGIAGESGAAGMGQAGSTSEVCHATPPQVCAGGLITLPKSCVDQASAVAGTTLPSKQCLTMCESVIGSCSVQTVQQTTITIACVTGCPTHQP